jgi:hypothetical protein
MADIVQSLFGITPESYQQAQAAQADRMALEYAQLKPLQQAQFAIGRGAYQLAGALGGEDPQLRMVSTRNAIAKQIDYTNPESMAAGIQALSQAGDTVGAMQLSDVLRKMQSEMALRQQRQAATQASLAQAGREYSARVPESIQKAQRIAELEGALETPDLTDAERRRLQAELAALQPKAGAEATTNEIRNADALARQKGAPGTPEYQAEFNKQLNRLTTKETPDRRPSVGADREAVALDMFDKNYYELTPTERSAVNKRIEEKEVGKATAGAPKVTNILPKQEAGLNKNKVELAGQVESTALSAPDRITLARNLRAFLPQAFTGLGSDVKLEASRFAAALGIPVSGTTESQIIDQILGQMTIGAAGQLKGALSDKDREFLKQTIGTRGLTRSALEFVSQRIEREARIDSELNNAIQEWQSSGKSLNNFNFVTQRSEAAKKIDADIKRLEELRRKQRGG